MLLKRFIVTPPLALILVVITILVVVNFIVWVLAGSGDIQKKLNRMGDALNYISGDMIKWTNEL